MAAMGTNRGHLYRERIGPENEGKELSGYLAERYAHTAERIWVERIREGRVRLDGETVSPSAELVWNEP